MLTRVRRADAVALDEAAALLVRGELVVFPTETVYGLGADAANRDAVAAVYRIKQRPAGHPLIVHVLDERLARAWSVWSQRAQRLAEAFWPGPLTLILERAADAPAWACGVESSIGLRAPAHPVARALLHDFTRRGGIGVAAPSANRFGRISPTRAEHVLDDLGEDAPLILDGGPCEVGVESTIVDLSRGRPVLLRPGGVAVAQLAAVLGEEVLERDAHAPRASGTLDAHYAPATPVELVDAAQVPERVGHWRAAGRRVALWSRSVPSSIADVGVSMSHDARTTARELYDTLRRLDRSGCDRIVIERVPPTPEWRAIADRLRRAAASS